MEKPAPTRSNRKVQFADQQQGNSRKRKASGDMETEENTNGDNMEELAGPSKSKTTGMTARPDRKKIEKEGSLPLSSCSSSEADNSYLGKITLTMRHHDAATSTTDVPPKKADDQGKKNGKEPPTVEVINQCVKYLLHLKEILQEKDYSQIFAAEEVYIHLPPTQSDKKHPKVVIPVMLAAMSDGTKFLPFVLLPQDPEEEYKGKLNWFVRPKPKFSNKATQKFLETMEATGDGRKLLLWNSNVNHLTDPIRKKLSELGIEGITIPDGAEKLLHPMYVSWEKKILQGTNAEPPKRATWKDKFLYRTGKLYNQWLDGTKSMDPPSPKEYMKWIYEAWKLVSSETIRDSFTACGFGNDEDDKKLFCFRKAPSGVKLLQKARLGRQAKEKEIVVQQPSHLKTISTHNKESESIRTGKSNAQSRVSPEIIEQNRFTATCDKILKKKYSSREATSWRSEENGASVQQKGREDSANNRAARESFGTHDEVTKVAFPQFSNYFAYGASEASVSSKTQPAPTAEVDKTVSQDKTEDHMTPSSSESRKRKITDGNSDKTSKKVNLSKSESGLELETGKQKKHIADAGSSEGFADHETPESTSKASDTKLEKTPETDILTAPRTKNIFRSLSLPGPSSYQRDIERGHEVKFIKFLIDISKTETSPLSRRELATKYRDLNHGVHLSEEFFNKQLKAERLVKRLKNLEIQDQVPILYLTQVPIPNSLRTEIRQEFEAVTFNSNGSLKTFHSADVEFNLKEFLKKVEAFLPSDLRIPCKPKIHSMTENLNGGETIKFNKLYESVKSCLHIIVLQHKRGSVSVHEMLTFLYSIVIHIRSSFLSGLVNDIQETLKQYNAYGVSPKMSLESARSVIDILLLACSQL